jgi:uncharacterized protein
MSFFARMLGLRARTAPAQRAAWLKLLEQARSGPLFASSLHGEAHWRGVAGVGFEIARIRSGLDMSMILAFGMIHDCRRYDEGWDPDHGLRGAHIALRSPALKRLMDDERIARLSQACLLHQKGRSNAGDRDIGACWDADRFSLVRLEITPNARFMSLGYDDAEMRDLIEVSRRISAEPPEWDELIDAAIKREGVGA